MIEERSVDWRALRWLATGYAGRMVIVRPVEPEATWKGVAASLGDGFVIELNCAKHMTLLSLARTFLHEVAHTKLHNLGPLDTVAVLYRTGHYQPGTGWACELYPDKATSIAVHQALLERSTRQEKEADEWADAEIRTYSRWMLTRIFLR